VKSSLKSLQLEKKEDIINKCLLTMFCNHITSIGKSGQIVKSRHQVREEFFSDARTAGFWDLYVS
ncbi:hypothetical protein ACQP3D_29110, partial [Escherichia coli]